MSFDTKSLSTEGAAFLDLSIRKSLTSLRQQLEKTKEPSLANTRVKTQIEIGENILHLLREKE